MTFPRNLRNITQNPRIIAKYSPSAAILPDMICVIRRKLFADYAKYANYKTELVMARNEINYMYTDLEVRILTIFSNETSYTEICVFRVLFSNPNPQIC